MTELLKNHAVAVSRHGATPTNGEHAIFVHHFPGLNYMQLAAVVEARYRDALAHLAATPGTDESGPVLPGWLADGDWQWSAYTSVVGATDADGTIRPTVASGERPFDLDLLCSISDQLTDLDRDAAERAWAAGAVLILSVDRFGAATAVPAADPLTTSVLVKTMRRFATAAGVPSDLLCTCCAQLPLGAQPEPSPGLVSASAEPGTDQIVDTAAEPATTGVDIPPAVRQRWAGATTVTGWGQLVADWLANDLPIQPGYRDTSSERGGPAVHLRALLADYARAGLIPDTYQPGLVDEDLRQRAYITGYATNEVADLLRDTLADTDLIIWIDPVSLNPESWSWLPVTTAGGVTRAAVGEVPGSWDRLLEVANDTSVPWGELQTLRYVHIIDPKWGRDRRLWLAVHQGLYPHDPQRTARLAFAYAAANLIMAQTGQPVTGPLADAWNELDGQQESAINPSLASAAWKIGQATGLPGSIKKMCDLLGSDAPFQVPSFSEILADIRAAQAEANAARPPDTRTKEQKLRGDLLTLMSAWSEDQYCAGWMGGLDRELRNRGGVWEILGRAIGWPVGYRAEHGWTTWEEAGNPD